MRVNFQLFHTVSVLCPDIQWNGKISSLQQDRHLRADPEDLPQGDDPRFESRVAYTGQANTNNKVNICIL